MDATIFGYEFKNPDLLSEALTSPSCKMDMPEIRDNQRLEFLGDAVLELLSSDELFRGCRHDDEGSLTVNRTRMVSTAALCEAASKLDFASRIRRNRNAQPLTASSKTIADAMEAVLGAAWIDGGFEAANKVYSAWHLSPTSAASANPKGELQNLAQAMKPVRHPVYALIATAGSAHAPRFTVRVTVEGIGSAEVTSSTHKEAEALAAAKLLLCWHQSN